MPLIQIGYRRLFDALGCSLHAGGEFKSKSEYGNGYFVEVYVGSKPKFGLCILRSDRYIVPGEDAKLMQADYKKDPAETTYPRNFFLEIYVYKLTEIEASLLNLIEKGNSDARNKVIAIAEQMRKDFIEAAEVISGSIGLRLHRQFVLELINENFVAATAAGEQIAIQFSGNWLERLDPVVVNETGKQSLGPFLQEIGKASLDAKDLAATALHWLCRAWRERDNVNSFVSLFIPLEVILSGQSTSHEDPTKSKADEIRKLIEDGGSKNSKNLLGFFDNLMRAQSPSLNQRFERLAREAALPGLENDIEAFKKFNKIRNGLLHRGKRDIQLSVLITGDDTKSLDQLVQKYLKWFFFRLRE